MAEPSKPEYSWRLQGAVYGTAFFNGNVQSMASTIVALLLVALINAELTLLIGFIFAARQFLTVTMSIYGGGLMDRFGTRTVIIWFGFVGLVAALLYPAAGPLFGVDFGAGQTHPAWGLVATLIIIQMVSGYAEATGWIGSQTLVGQLMRGQPVYAGRMTFVARVGGFLGPVAIGEFYDQFGPWGAYGFLAVWIFGGIIAASFLPDRLATQQATREEEADRAGDGTPTSENVSDYAATLRLLLVPAVVMVIMATVMRQAGSGVQTSFYVVWLRDELEFSGFHIGLLIGCANIASAFAALTIGPLTKRIASHWLLILMIGVSIVFISITPLLGALYPLLIIAICLRGIGQGLNLPLMMTILATNVGPSLQGRVTAMRISFNRFGGMCVPPIMGGLAEFIGLANSFYVVGVAGVLALCGLSIWISKSPGFANKGENHGTH